MCPSEATCLPVDFFLGIGDIISILAILFRPFGFLDPKKHLNYLAFQSVDFERDEGYYMYKCGCRCKHEYHMLCFMGFSMSTLCLYVH